MFILLNKRMSLLDVKEKREYEYLLLKLHADVMQCY